MAGSTRGQDEANPVFWLATRAGKMGPSCRLRIARFGPANKRLLGAGLRSSLTLQNETVYKTLIFTSVWQGYMYENLVRLSLLRLILKITSGHIHRDVEGDTSVV